MKVFIDGNEVEVKNDIRIVHFRDRTEGGDVHLIHNSEGMVIDIVDEKPGVFESPVTASTSIMVESLAEMAEIASAPPEDE
jgi:hypothetical protein